MDAAAAGAARHGAARQGLITFGLSYTPPERYIATAAPAEPQPTRTEPAPALEAPAVQGEAEALAGELGVPLWQRIWRSNTVNIGTASGALLLLTGMFFFQDALVKHTGEGQYIRHRELGVGDPAYPDQGEEQEASAYPEVKLIAR